MRSIPRCEGVVVSTGVVGEARVGRARRSLRRVWRRGARDVRSGAQGELPGFGEWDLAEREY